MIKLNMSDYERMSKDLKPCPFCGREALMEVHDRIPKGYVYTPTCTDKSCAGRLYKKWKTIDLAVNAWNMRATETKTDQWIPVKESLPKTTREVRVTDGYDVFIGWYDGKEWCSSSELFWPDTHPITAWMHYHIPKPYKEESEKV